MKKKIATIFIFISLFLCFMMTASAVDTPYVIAKLIPSLSVAYSESTAGTHKWFSGTNSASSKHKVYFESQKSTGDKWVMDKRILVDKGESLGDTLTNFTGSTALWRLKLNPYGVSTKR